MWRVILGALIMAVGIFIGWLLGAAKCRMDYEKGDKK